MAIQTEQGAKLCMTESELRAAYARKIATARITGDSVRRAELMDEAAAMYTGIQLYRERAGKASYG